MAKGYYKCECGKEFDNPQTFNGHKSHCEVHLKITGKVDLHNELRKNRSKKAAEVNHIKAEKRKMLELTKWLSEEHYCKHCGKLMTTKFGSGQFCCRACANSHIQTEEINAKRKKTRLENTALNKKHLKNLLVYESNPKLCKVCGKQLPYEHRLKNTCGDKNCEHIFRSMQCSLAHKEGRNKGWIKRNTISFPEKVWSTILDKNSIKYKRQVKVVNSLKHKYYFLDFVINNKIDLEIDGGQHLLPENIVRDNERNEFLKSLGYIIYRIPWKGIKTEQQKKFTKEEVEKFINFLKSCE